MNCCQDSKKNIILADCEKEEITDLAEGMAEVLKNQFTIKSKICNGEHGGFSNIKRYIIYALYPLGTLLRRNQYEYIFGWQQFFALFFAFYCKLFRLKKVNVVVAINFTYKNKKGLLGKIYNRFMKYSVDNKYLDYIHVPSWNYAKICSKTFGVPEEKFIVTPFGLPDTYEKWKNSKVEYNDYSFSIGRSNRDFDFLVEAWKKMPSTELLVIASDSYKPGVDLPNNVIHRTDIGGDAQFPYIANCKMMIIPIEDGSICSGDTVLLKAMSYEKPVVVTEPSTLAEMYIDNGVDGILTPKKTDRFCCILQTYIFNESQLKRLGCAARSKYIERFSRRSMGENLAKAVNGK